MEKYISALRALFRVRAQLKIRLCFLTGLILVPVTLHATNHQIRMDAMMAGLNGDTNIQFLQIVVNGNTQKDWGPQGNETQSRAMLVFFDAAGTQIGEFKFPHDPPPGANTVLIATAAFTNLTGLRADIVMPPMINPGSGKVCFKRNPANPFSFLVNLCLSYGSFSINTHRGSRFACANVADRGRSKSAHPFPEFFFWRHHQSQRRFPGWLPISHQHLRATC